MATYTELVNKVLSWSNRELDVFGSNQSNQYDRIKDFINYAADSAYRTLRVVPLEATRTYTVKAEDDGGNALAVPGDAIEFLQLSRVDESGEHFPYSSKFDIISFREVVERLDGYVGSGDNPDFRFWTRHQGELLLYPPYNEGEKFELYYYRRLPAPDARFTFSTSNVMADTGLIRPTDIPETWDFDMNSSYEVGDRVSYFSEEIENYYDLEETPEAFVDFAVATTYAAQTNVSFDSESYTNENEISGTDAWVLGSDYLVDTLVSFDGDNYIALETITGTLDDDDPSVDTARWAVDTTLNPDENDAWSIYTPASSNDWSLLDPATLDQSTSFFYYNPISRSSITALFELEDPNAVGINLDEDIGVVSRDDGDDAVPQGFYISKLTQNWLRDDNEKVLLFGALAEAFDFLEEPEQSQKYMAKFMKEIEELNMEDSKRIPSGGTITINYGSNLL